MEKELLLEGAEFIRKDMYDTANSLDYIADQILYCVTENREWLEALCYAMIKERVEHIRERAKELFVDLDIEEDDKTSNSKSSTEEED